MYNFSAVPTVSTTTSRRFHLGAATISISDTPFGHTTFILTFPFATSPSLTSQFSMVSTCRRIGCKNTAVRPNAGKVRDQCYSHVLHIACIRAPRSQVTHSTVVQEKAAFTQSSSSSDHCDPYKSSSSRQICSPVTSRTTDTPKLLGFGLLRSRRTLGDQSYRSILNTDGYTGKKGVLPI